MSRSKKISLGFRVVNTRTGEVLSETFDRRQPAHDFIRKFYLARGMQPDGLGRFALRPGDPSVGVEQLTEYVDAQVYAETQKAKKSAVPRVARHKAAGKHRVSKPTGEMKPAQINAELDKLDALVSKINERMIADGRGYETSNETWTKTDPLALEWREASQRRMDLLREIERRYNGGPSFRAPSRFPSGWRAGR